MPLFILPNIQESFLATFPQLGQADVLYTITREKHPQLSLQFCCSTGMTPATPTSAHWVNETDTQGIAFPCEGSYTEAPAHKPHYQALAKVSRTAAGTVCGPPPPLSLFFRSVRGLPRRPSAAFFPSVQSLRGPATLGL